MDPTVQGAWIAATSGFVGVLVGVGGTTIVAVTGLRNTSKATDKTLKASRDDRVWARKADAYQDAIAAALQRHDQRQHVVEAKTLPDTLEPQLGPEWFDMQSRLRTFGAREVVMAFENSMKATERLDAQHEDNAVTKDFEPALHEAMELDTKLVDAIRGDLGI